MKVLIDARSIVEPTRCGVQRVAESLVAAYAASFPEDQLICVTTGSVKPSLPPSIADQKNVTHSHIHLPNKLWSVLCIFRMTSLIRYAEHRTGKIDAAFFPNIGFIGRNATRADAPSILLLHDLSFIIEPKWFSLKQRIWHRAVRATQHIRNATHLLAVSERTKNDAHRLLGIPLERISVIPIGPTNEGARRGVTHHDPTSKRYALVLGGSDPRKNARTAITAVNQLREEEHYRDIECTILGAQSPRPSDDELQSLYANAAVFLYPSWYEGYGLPLHEAASFGTPRVASSAGSLVETAPPGTLFANPAKPHQWVEAMRVALKTPRTNCPAHADGWTHASAILRNALISSKNDNSS
jgi:glycosyltransferase involved in cell wall biosynthesis